MKWPAHDAIPMLDEETIHIWFADLNHIELKPESLTTAELSRARQFKQIIHQEYFIKTRSLLRHFLSRYTENISTELLLDTLENGKLFLVNSTLKFNLAHSDHLAIFAFNQTCELGVDIEVKRPIKELNAIIERIASQDEQQYILESHDKIDAFFKLWTRKEAAIKCTGDGLLAPLMSINTTDSQGNIINPIQYPNYHSLYLMDLTITPDIAAALTMEKVKKTEVFKI